ncbi:hypothetical protein GobsT_18420 [Gemmata obscuriglobus]|uniref:hypothetical protein n=1 Tax=Gemmata obscuriglobus TaxID=114 RepID=UPI0011CD2B22|nr:hypothetical protein [Gemmata obscuriglobus]QEG27089.1 hypothetical protein GobsT_18420 [Gemmata obscuriglobus]VTS03562.1 unnamed protein product [Gemmata obscuriglobus UQM 2246]
MLSGLISRFDAALTRKVEQIRPVRKKVARRGSITILLLAVATTLILNNGGPGEGPDTPFHRFLYQPLLFLMWSALFCELAYCHVRKNWGDDPGPFKTLNSTKLLAAFAPGLVLWAGFVGVSTRMVMDILQPVILQPFGGGGRCGHGTVVLIHYSLAILMNFVAYILARGDRPPMPTPCSTPQPQVQSNPTADYVILAIN